MIDRNSNRGVLLFQDRTWVARSERTRRTSRVDRSSTGGTLGFRRTEA